MMEWLQMNGDGIYVWPCYVITLLVLIANVQVARSNRRKWLSRAAERARLAKQSERRS
ncbi:MAG: heme exporter protein CcmD [Pseudomonadota bacterium]